MIEIISAALIPFVVMHWSLARSRKRIERIISEI